MLLKFRQTVKPQRNVFLFFVFLRPPGAADSGEGGGKEAQEPDAERGFRGEGEGRGLRGGWRRREPHRPQP